MACLQTRNYRAFIQEAARILRRGGLYIAGEWCFRPVRGNDVQFPHGTPICRFFDLVATVVYERRGLRPVAEQIKPMLERSGCFHDVQSTPLEFEVGSSYRIFEKYAETMRVLLLEGGVRRDEVEEVVRQYLEQLRSIPGLKIKYYLIHARRA